MCYILFVSLYRDKIVYYMFIAEFIFSQNSNIICNNLHFPFLIAHTIYFVFTFILPPWVGRLDKISQVNLSQGDGQ